MTTLRTAAQQALEACEQRLPLNGQAAIIDELNNLRAALAQQAKPVEPVATLIAQRDALLEALKYLDKEFRQHGRRHWPEAVRVRAAIKSVEGEKT